MRLAFIRGFVPYPTLSVDATCVYSLSLGREGLNIRPSRVVLNLAVFTCHLTCAFWIHTTRKYYCCKVPSFVAPSEAPSLGLMTDRVKSSHDRA